MEACKRRALNKHQAAILLDLDVAHIMDELFEHAALPRELYDALLEAPRAEGVRALLEWLMANGDDASYDRFVDALAKDYRWLWEKLTQSAEGGDPGDERAELTESAEDALWRADVPLLPPHFVQRHNLADRVRRALASLRRLGVVVLHGMAGSGKTTAAAAALRVHPDPLLLRAPLYWLRLTDVRTHADALDPLSQLYRRAACWVGEIAAFSSMSSLSSAAESVSPSASLMGFSDDAAASWSGWRDARDSVRNLFNRDPLKEALVVLDDVCSAAALEAFDIGCKLLVTTRDISLLRTVHHTLITIDEGFTEAESLGVLASWLRVPASQLPSAARKLHARVHGSPLLVGMVGAELAEHREQLLDGAAAWRRYVDKLTRRDLLPFFRGGGGAESAPELAVKLCVRAVEPELQERLLALAVLAPGARARAAVLARLWASTVQDAERTLARLAAKSLVARHYDKEAKEYEHSVHELIAACLRSLHAPGALRTLHQSLLARYGLADDVCAALPDDGYIALHLPHHIQESGMDQLWALYGCIETVGQLVRAAGHARVLTALQRYRAVACRSEPQRAAADQLAEWLAAHGAALHRYPRTDILQSLLLHAPLGPLRARAERLARSHPHRLYFSALLHEEGDAARAYLELHAPGAVMATCWARDLLAAGLGDGRAVAFDTRTGAAACELAPGAGAVRWLGACPLAPSLIACVHDTGELRVAEVEGADGYDLEEATSLDEDEPRGWSVRRDICGAVWMHSVCRLLAYTRTELLEYSCAGAERVLCTHLPHVVSVSTCGGDEVCLVALRRELRALSLRDAAAVLWTLTLTHAPVALAGAALLCEDAAFRVEMDGSLREVWRSEGARAHLGALSVDSGTLFVATEDAVLAVPTSGRGNGAWVVTRGRAAALCASVTADEDACDVLCVADVERVLRVWRLQPQYAHTYRARLTGEFACGWGDHRTDTPPRTASAPAASPRSTPPPSPARRTRSAPKSLRLNLCGIGAEADCATRPLLAAVDTDNYVTVWTGARQVSSACGPTHARVTALAASPCATTVLIGLRTGQVLLHTPAARATVTLAHLNSAVHYLEFVSCDGGGEEGVIVAGARGGCVVACTRRGGDWLPHMLHSGNALLGSREMLDQINNTRMWRSGISSGSSPGSEESAPRLCRAGQLVRAWWLPGEGLLTLEENACMKLWSADTLQLSSVLTGRGQAVVTHAHMRADTVAIAYKHHAFKTMRIRADGGDVPKPVEEREIVLGVRIASLAVSSRGKLVAIGTHEGAVSLWTPGTSSSPARQLALLRLHSAPVTHLQFSPEVEGAPVVLLSGGVELAWWDVTAAAAAARTSLNVLSPLRPAERRADTASAFRFGAAAAAGARYLSRWSHVRPEVHGRGGSLLSVIRLGGCVRRVDADAAFVGFGCVDTSGVRTLLTLLPPSPTDTT